MVAEQAFSVDARAPLRELLEALAIEVGELASTADGLQDLIGRLMERPHAAQADAMERAQELDGLVQRLQGLQSFLHVLKSRPLADVAADARVASAGLRLTRQARRLGRLGAAARDTTGRGDYDLF